MTASGALERPTWGLRNEQKSNGGRAWSQEDIDTARAVIRVLDHWSSIALGAFGDARGRGSGARVSPPPKQLGNMADALGTREHAIRFAGAICFKRQQGIIKYLLIKTDKGRYIIPKGRIKEHETLAEAAARYAFEEAGIVGEIATNSTLLFRHVKGKDRLEQLIGANIIECTQQISRPFRFRSPRWVSLAHAKRLLAEGKPPEYGRYASRLLDEANAVIERCAVPVRQVAALPYRVGPRRGVEVLLITSRHTRRWVLPKGHIVEGRPPSYSAAEEAREEGGVLGRIDVRSFGDYTYRRLRQLYHVDVYPLRVLNELADWPEKQERTRQWVTVHEAAQRVAEQELKEILVAFGRRYANAA